MTIYTRMGDEGFTNRPNGRRVRKSDQQIDAVGAVDELNSSIGWCFQAAGDGRQEEIREALAPLQSELLALGAVLAVAGTDSPPDVELDESAVERMERQIDAAWQKLPELKQFVLSRGCELACRLHVARTICRRAERAAVAAAEAEKRIPTALFKYLNRLSDLLFALARLANHNEGIDEQTWGRRKSQ